MKLIILFVCILNASENKYIGTFFVKEIFVHLHQGPSKSTTSLTTLSCGQSLRIWEKKSDPKGWFYTKVGVYKGHVHVSHLSLKKEKCFQEKYEKFFNSLNLDLSDMYYFGRLYDRYIQTNSNLGKSIN